MKIMKTKLWSMILSLLCVVGMSVESGWGMNKLDQVELKNRPHQTQVASTKQAINRLSKNSSETDIQTAITGASKNYRVLNDVKILLDKLLDETPPFEKISNVIQNLLNPSATTPSQQTQPIQTPQGSGTSGATADLIPGKLTADNFKTKLATYLSQLKNNPQATSDVNPVLTTMKSLKDIKSADFKGHNQNYLEALSSLAKSDSELFNKLVPIKIKRGTQEISVLADQDDQGRTVLHYAAEAGDAELVKQILAAAQNLGK